MPDPTAIGPRADHHDGDAGEGAGETEPPTRRPPLDRDLEALASGHLDFEQAERAGADRQPDRRRRWLCIRATPAGLNRTRRACSSGFDTTTRSPRSVDWTVSVVVPADDQLDSILVRGERIEPPDDERVGVR